MTLDEAARVVKSISFRAGVSTWRMRITARLGHENPAYRTYMDSSPPIVVRFVVDVPHRETNQLVEVLSEHEYNEYDLRRFTPAQFTDELLRQFLSFVRHEALESFFVDGHIWCDPHKAGL